MKAISVWSFMRIELCFLLAALLLMSSGLLRGDSYIHVPPFENLKSDMLVDGSYDIRYDLYPQLLKFPIVRDTLKTVLLRVSEIGGRVFLDIPSWEYLSGNIGENVHIGPDKRNIWSAPRESFFSPGKDYSFRLVEVK